MAKTILIVDQNQETKKLKEGIFKFSNFTVKSASDGHEALAVAKQGGIDIILSDSPMMLMENEDFVDNIKKGVDTKNIPIVMLAGINENGNKVRMQEKGVSEFILKPVNFESLIKRVKELANSVDMLYIAN